MGRPVLAACAIRGLPPAGDLPPETRPRAAISRAPKLTGPVRLRAQRMLMQASQYLHILLGGSVPPYDPGHAHRARPWKLPDGPNLTPGGRTAIPAGEIAWTRHLGAQSEG